MEVKIDAKIVKSGPDCEYDDDITLSIYRDTKNHNDIVLIVNNNKIKVNKLELEKSLSIL